jgi:Putative stress-induced transcription regulator
MPRCSLPPGTYIATTNEAAVDSSTTDVAPLTWRRRYHLSVTDHTPSVASGNAVQGLLGSLARTVTADGTDLLGTREEAVPWLRAAGLLPDDAVISGSEHGALLRLRDALRDVLAARASGAADPDATARLTRALADGRLVVTVSPAGTAVLASSARASYSNAVAAIAIAVAQAW